MYKLVLDSNIINKCNQLNLTKDFFDSLKVEIWTPTYVKNEVLSSEKEYLIDTLEKLDYKITGFFGFSDNPNSLGFAELFDDSSDGGLFYNLEYDNFIKSTVEKHQNDRYIATLSNLNNAIFVTCDKKAYKDADNNSIISLYFNENWTKIEFKKQLIVIINRLVEIE